MVRDNYSAPWLDQDFTDLLSTIDIVYTVKPSDVNEELRYSLRSLKNIPFRKVVIVGHKPDWIKGVYHIPTKQIYPNKVMNTNRNWHEISKSKQVTKKFILMNDDMFFMKPIKNVPFAHMCDHRDFMKSYASKHPTSYYTKVIRSTERRLQELGIKNAKCFELHTPTIISRQAIRTAFEGSSYQFSPLNIRTLALSLMEVDSRLMPDVKFYPAKEQLRNPKTNIDNLPVISTSDTVWRGPIGEYIRNKFREPSKYEKR